jgi:hypothetical protein
VPTTLRGGHGGYGHRKPSNHRAVLPDRERLDSPTVTGDQSSAQSKNIAAMDYGSFRDQLAFSIGFAPGPKPRSAAPDREDHVSDDARLQLAERVVEHLK